jgi:hypothetical protein
MSRIDRITYYDFADMNYASFFLTGFSEHENRHACRLMISRSLPVHLRERMMEGGWAKTVPSICLFKIGRIDQEFYFCIDARDGCRTTPAGGMGYHLPLLDEVRLYFKVNHNEEAVRTDPLLKAYARKIVPVAPCFPLRPNRLLPLLSRIVGSNVIAGSAHNAASRIRALAQFPDLEEIQRLRNVDKQIDVFFVSAFYQEPHHSAAMESRCQIMKGIRNHRDLVSVVGFTGEPSGECSQFKCDRYTLRDYLRNLSKARVAIYVRGLHDCLSFKIGQYLALGMPIVGQTISNNRKALYCHESFSEQFAFDRPTEIVNKVVQLLREPSRLKALGESNSRVFDARLSPQATAGDILECLRSEVN